MKTFKQLITTLDTSIKKKKERLPSLETVFGSHSKGEKLPSLETVFGSHSRPKPSNIKESVDLAKDKLGDDDIDRDEDKIHADNDLEHATPIHHYSIDSRAVNKYHHEKYNEVDNPTHSPGKIKQLEEHSRQLDEHLDKHSIKHDIHVYTGLSRPPHHLFKGHDKDTVKFHHPAYMSTSTNYRSATEFAAHRNKEEDRVDPSNHKVRNESQPRDMPVRHVLKLHVPKGTKGGSVKSQSEYSKENEILLHRGHNIEIHRHPSISHSSSVTGSHRVLVWHGKIVGHSRED